MESHPPLQSLPLLATLAPPSQSHEFPVPFVQLEAPTCFNTAERLTPDIHSYRLISLIKLSPFVRTVAQSSSHHQKLSPLTNLTIVRVLRTQSPHVVAEQLSLTAEDVHLLLRLNLVALPPPLFANPPQRLQQYPLRDPCPHQLQSYRPHWLDTHHLRPRSTHLLLRQRTIPNDSPRTNFYSFPVHYLTSTRSSYLRSSLRFPNYPHPIMTTHPRSTSTISLPSSK